MRFRTLAIAAALSAGLVQTGAAFAPHKGAERPVVAAGRAPRLHRDIGWRTSPAGLAGWRAQWDRDTDVPLRLWGPSIPAPRASSDPAAAEAAARQFLAAHLALLAPGASITDFTLAANQVDPTGRVRTVSFVQSAHGLPVVGGALGVAFVRDHLVLASSTALPDVAVRLPGGPLPASTLERAAVDWLGRDGIAVAVRGQGDRVIVPIVHARGVSGVDIEYRVAETVSVEATRQAGRWDVWVDAADASPIARRSTINFASGVVAFDVPDRWPGGTRGAQPAPNATHTINGTPVTADLDGTVTWTGADPATVAPGLSGPYVAITNKAGSLVNETLSLASGGSVTWSKAADEYGDAQLSAFVFASTAKQFARTRLNPNLAWFDSPVSVNVNEQQTCNAYSTGDDIHFFKKDNQCENTGRIADVVYHEFGHSVHYNSIIAGQGSFDSSLSEGLADTLAVSITGDHGMGRGFFFNDQALRDVDPVGIEKKWPQDADGEPHDEGEIIGEALWDLRTGLQAKLGDTAGFDRFLEIYYGIMQRASDIPSTYAEALVADDDDGDLSNGTPNQCEINAAFGLHGLSDPAVTLGLMPPARDGYNISLHVSPPSQSSCPPPSIDSAVLTWTPQSGNGGQVDLTAAGDTWSAQIPTQPDGTVVKYSVTVTLSDGSSITYPQNRADPEYQFYVGPVTPIWCADFEAGADDWTHAASPTNRDEWEAGMPLGVGGDPKVAHGGTSVFGIDLGSDDGLYRGGTKQWAESPEIDLAGHTNVRLQYYRWLNVEDGAYDQATIYANGEAVWANRASSGMPTSDEINHTVKEWRFQDVDLSAQAASGKIKLKFELDSDRGLELGGWTMDDVCIVAVAGPGATCGNGAVDTGETCDDGNTTDGDGCSATCQLEDAPTDGGCCSTSTKPAGALLLSLFTMGMLFVRRRRTA